MKRRALWFALSMLFAVGLLRAVEKLPPGYQAWLEDVSPIITKTERDVYLELRAPEDREKFIRMFWRARDPKPDTSVNEFEGEYLERLRFVDETFGHDSPMRASRTDRGFYYLLLGAPLERRFFTTQSDLWPLELWFYKGGEQVGLPAFFNLIFYQPEGIGEYKLYQPGLDGPEKLVSSRMSANPGQRGISLKIIKATSAELAGASVSCIPGENPGGLGSLSSENLLASIRQLPERKYSGGYARSYLSFKEYVESDYVTNYLNSSFQIRVFKHGGQPFLHWTIEPEKMNFAADGSDVYASFQFVMRLEDEHGSPLLERTEEIPVHLTPEQYKSHEHQRFAFQDALPVIPGAHRALFLLKNKTAKDFSSFQTDFVVPDAGTPRLSAPLLYHGEEAMPAAQGARLKAFAFEGRQYVVGARNEFLPSETLGVLVQAWDLDRLGLAARPALVFEIQSLDTGTPVTTQPLSAVGSPAAGAAGITLTGTYSLGEDKPGFYRIAISALGPDGKKLLTEKEAFTVLAKPYPTVPWVYARLHDAYPGPEHSMTLGAEYFAVRDYGRARDAILTALQAREDPAARLMLAKALYGLNSYKESLDQALPLYERKPERETAKVIALDFAALHDWASSATYLEKIMAETTEIGVLNLAAECYINLSHPERALPLLQKSLEFLPDQPAVKSLEAQAKRQLGRQ